MEISLTFVEKQIQMGTVYNQAKIYVTHAHVFTTLNEARMYRDTTNAEMLGMIEDE